MKQVKVKQVLIAISLLKKAINKSSVLPILEDILFKDGHLEATQLDFSIGIPMDFTGVPVSIPFKQFSKAMTNCKQDEVAFVTSFDKGKKPKLEIRGVNGFLITICGDDANDFPKTMLSCDAKDLIADGMTFPASYVKEIINASDFISNDELRPAMFGVLCGAKAVTGTDAYTLFSRVTEEVKMPLKFNSSYEDGGIIMRKEIINLLKLKPQLFTMKASRTNLFCAFEDGIRFSFRYMDAVYPQYGAVMPAIENSPIQMTVNTAKLIDVLKQGEFAMNPSTKQFVLDFRKGECVVTTCDLDYNMEFKNTITCETKGEIQIGINQALMLKCLAHCEDEVVLYMSTPTRAIRVGEDLLLMPIIINT